MNGYATEPRIVGLQLEFWPKTKLEIEQSEKAVHGCCPRPANAFRCSSHTIKNKVEQNRNHNKEK